MHLTLPGEQLQEKVPWFAYLVKQGEEGEEVTVTSVDDAAQLPHIGRDSDIDGVFVIRTQQGLDMFFEQYHGQEEPLTQANLLEGGSLHVFTRANTLAIYGAGEWRRLEGPHWFETALSRGE